MILDSKTGGFNKNMMGGGSIFKGIEQIKAFNAELASSNSKYRAYLNTMKEAEPWAQKVVKLNKLQAVGFKDGTKHMVSYTASLVGATIKTVALQAASMALNAALTWGISLAIQAVVTLIQKAWELVPTIKNLQKQFDKVAEEFDSLISEEQSLNDELTTTQERIDEIKSKGKLSFTDASELKRLEQQNSLLKRSLELNQQNKKLAFDSYKNAFTNLVRGQTGKTYSSLYSWQTAIDPNSGNEYTTSDAKVISTTEYLKELVQAYKDAGEHQDEFISNTTGVHWSQEDINNKISEFGDTVTKYQDYLQKLNEQGYQYGTNDVLDKTIDDANHLIDTFMALNGSTTTLFADVLGRDKFAKANEGIKNLSDISSQSLQKLYADTKGVQGGFYDFVNYILSLNTIDWKTVLGEYAFNNLDVDKNGVISELELFNETTGQCKLSTEQWAKVMPLLSNELNKVEEAAKGANSTVKSFKNIANEIDTAIDAITNAQTDMSENGYLTVDSIIALEEAGLTDYLKETENGYVLANGALETYLDSQGKTYQNAVTDAVKNASKLATQQEAVAAGYENSAKGLLLYLKAQKALAISQIPNDEMRMFNYKKIIEQYDPAINSIETAINNQNKYNKIVKTKKKEIKTDEPSGSKTNKTAENKIAYYKHQHEMGIISEAAYYKKLEKIRKDYYAGKKDYLNRDRELQEEYHDWEVDKAKETFETKSESLIQNFIDQKDPKKKRKNNKKGYTFKEFKADYNKLIADVKKVDKEAAKELEDNRDEIFEDAKESFVNREINDLKSKLDLGKITNDEYIKRLNNIGTKLKKLGIDIKDFPDIEADIKLTVHEDEVDKALETFEKEVEKVISDYVEGKIDYSTYEKKYKNLINNVKKIDKDEAAKLKSEFSDNTKEARISKMKYRFGRLDYKKEYGFLTDKKYLQEYSNLNDYYYEKGLLSAEEYADNVGKIYDGFKDLYREDYEAKKESLEKQKEEITEFYDDLIEAKQKEHEEEDYKEEQAEKRKTVSDIDRQIAELQKDGSEKAKARIAELEEDRKNAQKELDDFEKDKARQDEIDRLEEEKKASIENIEQQIENIDKTLEDLDTNTKDIRNAVIQYAKAKGVDIQFAYASGTRSSVGGFGRINEKGIEMISAPDGNGNYIPMLPNSYVFSAKATEFLWKLATEHSLPQAMYNSIAKSIKTQSNTPSVNIAQPITITMGDVIVKGNADKQTVADIKKQQENTVRMVLQKIKELQK